MADFVDPTRESFGLFKDLPRDHPVQMLNLVLLNEKAVYPDGTTCSGAEAQGRRLSEPETSG